MIDTGIGDRDFVQIKGRLRVLPRPGECRNVPRHNPRVELRLCTSPRKFGQVVEPDVRAREDTEP